jgi:hypothetical protein
MTSFHKARAAGFIAGVVATAPASARGGGGMGGGGMRGGPGAPSFATRLGPSYSGLRAVI